MRRLLTGYAVSFNRRHGRSGHLFQNRYHSVVCEEDAYLLELVRYIHLNPVKVGLVDGLGQLDDSPLTGHAVLMGNRSFAGQNIDAVLDHFAKRKSVAIASYRKFMQDGLGSEGEESKPTANIKQTIRKLGRKSEDLADDQQVLGSSAFAAELQRMTGDNQSPTLGLAELLSRVAGIFRVDPQALCGRGRTRALSDARALFCFLAFSHMRHNGAEVARKLNVSRSAICLAVRRGEKLVQERPDLLDVVGNLTK